MDAFRATLEEVTEADALLHLVDLSHPAWLSHIRSVRDILAQMPIAPGPALVAFNKIDPLFLLQFPHRSRSRSLVDSGRSQEYFTTTAKSECL